MKYSLTKGLNRLSILDVIGILIGLTGIVSLYIDLPFKVLSLAGICGIAYWALYLFIWIFTPVIRDWILVNGHVMRRILCGVLLTPFSLGLLCKFFSPQVTADNLLSPTENCSESVNSAQPHQDTEQKESLFLNVYYHYTDPGNQMEANTDIGRLWASVIAIFGILLMNGLLVSTLVGWFDRRREAWNKGDIRYKRFFGCIYRHSYIIIGGNEMICGIIRNIFAQDKQAYILISTSRSVEELRRELFSFLQPDECLRVIFYYGNRTAKEDINELNFKKAEEVFILGENVELNEQESCHDTLNMHCLELIAKNLKHNRGNAPVLKCNVMFEYQSTFSIFQYSEISNDIKDIIDFRPFNRYEMWAQKVLICKELSDYSRCKYLPLEGTTGIQADSEEFVHFIVTGMSRMGIAMAIEAAHLAHFPNFETKKKRTRITFIDGNMEQEIDFFKGRFDALFELSRQRFIRIPEKYKVYDNTRIYSDYVKYPWSNPLTDAASNSRYKGNYLGEDFLDIEWEFIEGNIEEPLIQQYLKDAALNKQAKLTLAVCFTETNKTLASAIYLPKTIFEKAQQVLVYQPTDDSLIRNLKSSEHQAPYNGKLKSFGMLSDTYDDDIISDSQYIAGLVNQKYSKISENYSAYESKIEKLTEQFMDKERQQRAHAIHLQNMDAMREQFDQETLCQKEEHIRGLLGSNISPKVKDKTPVSYWWSDVYHANMMWTKLRCAGLTSSATQLTDRQIWDISNLEHNRWNMEQLLMLYRPTTPLEHFLIINNKEMLKPLKKLMVHYDISSCDMLKEIDSTFIYDVGFAEELVHFYHALQRHHQNARNSYQMRQE